MTIDVAALLANFEEVRPVRHAGVYLLLDGDAIVYVGQTSNRDGRLASHRSDADEGRAGAMKFTRFLWLEVVGAASALRLNYERALIRALRPKYNAKVPKRRAGDADALALLGLHGVEVIGPGRRGDA